MKLLIAMLLLMMALPVLATNPRKKNVPGYNTAAEAIYEGTIEDLRDRECPVRGGVGSHIILKLEDGSTIEVHLALTGFSKMLDMNLHTGDAIEVTGWKTEFEGVQTIFAREIKHGNERFVLRAKDGTPAWMY